MRTRIIGVLFWVLTAALVTGLNSCKYATEDITDASVLPTVQLSVDSINRTDSLSTKIRLQWFGSVKDGYVTGYRIAWGFAPFANPDAELAAQSTITRSVDSTFLFTLRGLNGGTVHFYIQALDNRGRAGRPAYLPIRVKNFSPTARIVTSGLPVASDVYSVLTFPIDVSDIDGNETIDSVYIKINDGGWFPVNRNASLVSIVAQDPRSSSIASGLARVYSTVEATSIVTTQMPGLASGIRVGDSNQVYVRCKDLAGVFSKTDTAARRFFIRRQTSDLLLVDSWNDGGTADANYQTVLGQVYPAGYDKIDLYENNNQYQPIQPRLWRVAFGLTLKQYKKVIWYSDVANHIVRNVADPNSTLLQTASNAIKDFVDGNGKLMVSCRNYIIPDGTPNTKSYPNGSLITRILSIDTIFNNDLNVRLAGNVNLNVSASSGFPVLRTNAGLITGFMPFANTSDATPLYTGNMTRSGNPYRNNLIALRRQNAANGRTNLVFFAIDFHLLAGDATAQRDCMDRILNQEFNW